MIWDEIDVEGSPSSNDVKRAVAAALAMPESKIEICDDAGADPKGAPELRVELTKRKGQFPTRLGFYFTAGAPADRGKTHAALAAKLGKRILVSDSGEDPYRRLAIEPSGQKKTVDLDVRALDEQDQLELAAPKKERAMSSDDRLARLGLSHLADDPKALKKELTRLVEADELEQAKIEQEMVALRAKLGVEVVAAVEAFDTPSATTRSTGIRSLRKKS